MLSPFGCWLLPGLQLTSGPPEGKKEKKTGLPQQGSEVEKWRNSYSNIRLFSKSNSELDKKRDSEVLVVGYPLRARISSGPRFESVAL